MEDGIEKMDDGCRNTERETKEGGNNKLTRALCNRNKIIINCKVSNCFPLFFSQFENARQTKAFFVFDLGKVKLETLKSKNVVNVFSQIITSIYILLNELYKES